MATVLGENREEAMRVGYMAADWHVPISYETYEESLADWRIQSIERDGVCIGALYRNEQSGEVHGAILPGYRRRWATRGLLREIFRDENVNTCVSPGHEFVCGILERLGLAQRADGKFFKRRKTWVSN